MQQLLVQYNFAIAALTIPRCSGFRQASLSPVLISADFKSRFRCGRLTNRDPDEAVIERKSIKERTQRLIVVPIPEHYPHCRGHKRMVQKAMASILHLDRGSWLFACRHSGTGAYQPHVMPKR